MSLESEFRQVIAEMHLISHGTTGAFDGRVTGAKERPLMPAGELRPLWEEFERRWAKAWGRPARETSLAEAREALRNWKVQKAAPVIEPGSMAWRREIANASGSDKELVRIYGVSRMTLWRYRRDYRTEEAA
jgi:hypothetical protein